MRFAFCLFLVGAVCTGCAGSQWHVLTDKDGLTLTISNPTEQPDPTTWIKADGAYTRARLIVEMGKLAGDSGLGAELVILAEQAKAREYESARLDALRLTTWFEEKKHQHRIPPTYTRRAFGQPDHHKP